MPEALKTALLPLYQQIAAPWRWWRLSRLVAERRAPITIFFYHRVADDQRVPWTIGNGAFRRQIEWLQQHADLICMEEAHRRMADGNPHPAAHITFDDGYADNLDQAIPYLIEHNVPCTYFVTLDPVLTGRPFPHDAALGQRLAPNSISELRGMADAGIEIGAHTRTHIDLGKSLDPATLHDEIIASADELEQRLGHPVRFFAFPFGHPRNVSPAALETAMGGRFRVIVSAYGGYNIPRSPRSEVLPGHLRRFGADPRFARFRNVARFDPRKARQRDRLVTEVVPHGPLPSPVPNLVPFEEVSA